MGMQDIFSASHIPDNQNWKSFYFRSITNQVKHLISFIEQNKKNPDALAKHFESIVVTIEEAASHPEIETRANLIKLFRSLHPLPLWWGKSTEWARIIETIIKIAKETPNIRGLFWLYLTQSEILITSGDEKKALILAERALSLAQDYEDPEMIFRAEMTVFEAKKDLVTTRYEVMEANYRILNSMGSLLASLRVAQPEDWRQQLRDIQ